MSRGQDKCPCSTRRRCSNSSSSTSGASSYKEIERGTLRIDGQLVAHRQFASNTIEVEVSGVHWPDASQLYVVKAGWFSACVAARPGISNNASSATAVRRRTLAGFAGRTCCVPFCCAATSATNDKLATRIFASTRCSSLVCGSAQTSTGRLLFPLNVQRDQVPSVPPQPTKWHAQWLLRSSSASPTPSS